MKKLSGLIILMALLASPLVMTLPVKEWVARAGELRTLAATAGWVAPLGFFVVAALGTALGLPRLVFCSLGGWLFGFAWGFGLSHFGTLAGAYGMFLLARGSKPERLLRRFPKLRSLTVPGGRSDWGTVFLVRQLPIGGLYNDVLLGWSRVSHQDFWLGSFLGFLPQGVTATLVGAGLIQAEPVSLGAWLAAAAGAFVVLSYSVKWAAGRRGRLSAGAA